MANVRISFIGSNKSKTNDTDLECFLNQNNEITIILNDGYDLAKLISLDKSTAIKLAKTLRTEINKIKEVSNG